jgi:hypothetical protein
VKRIALMVMIARSVLVLGVFLLVQQLLVHHLVAVRYYCAVSVFVFMRLFMILTKDASCETLY